MSKLDENRRYKWSNSATNLLVSIWSHDMVQDKFKSWSRNQAIWESIARFMVRKGFDVTGVQCRIRIKNLLRHYNDAVRIKNRSGFERYFDRFHKVVNNKSRKGRRLKNTNPKQTMMFEIDENDEGAVGFSELSLDVEQPNNPKTSVGNFRIVDVNNQEVQVTIPLIDKEVMTNLENIIIKAIDNQTKAISETVRLQTEIIEKMLVSERKRFEAILFAERKGGN